MTQTLVIVDYGAGNLTSVKLALHTLGTEGIVTSDPRVVASADRIIFPGVGAAGAAMANLRRGGLDTALKDAVQAGTPLLGICVGMQVLLDFSEEDGGTEMLGIIPGSVVRFQPKDRWNKVPQIGWNAVTWNPENIRIQAVQSLLQNIPVGSDFYFVHSFYPMPKDRQCVLAETDYAGGTFASLLRYKNVAAAQFHPEKSGKLGLQLLANFISWESGGASGLYTTKSVPTPFVIQ